MTGSIVLEDVLARVALSRRYRWVAQDVVERLAREEIPHSRNLADAEKRTKRRLHQIFGAYTGQPDYARLLLEIAAAREQGDEQLRAACRMAMAQHASARERLSILEQFYERIFAVTGVPASISDIACGLNPLALPWMGLPSGSRYVACDIDFGLVSFVDGFLDLMAVAHRADLCDIVTATPAEPCDVALLLKTIPCLDHQDPQAIQRLMQALLGCTRYIVVSFPTQSLGGRNRGMARNYRIRLTALLAALQPQPELVEEVELPGELIYVVGGREQGTARC
jgi:16S rRNA (guanine(1405)-N(7))-methyltransferase